jgi:hypothetical protein
MPDEGDWGCGRIHGPGEADTRKASSEASSAEKGLITPEAAGVRLFSSA